jgi:hypothetical protein
MRLPRDFHVKMTNTRTFQLSSKNEKYSPAISTRLRVVLPPLCVVWVTRRVRRLAAGWSLSGCSLELALDFHHLPFNLSPSDIVVINNNNNNNSSNNSNPFWLLSSS